MALQVWLPLSGNTSNYGLSDLEAQRAGQISYGSGLFGDKCFQSGDGVVIIHGTSLPAVFTLSMWIKPDSPSINATLLAFGNGDSIDMSTDTVTYKFKGGSLVADNSTAFEANDADKYLIIQFELMNYLEYFRLIITIPHNNKKEESFSAWIIAIISVIAFVVIMVIIVIGARKGNECCQNTLGCCTICCICCYCCEICSRIGRGK